MSEPAATTPIVQHDQQNRRFILRSPDGELLSALEYRESGGVIAFTHTFTPAPRRGRGHAARLVRAAVDDVRRHRELRISPVCSYVAVWFQHHPEDADLLAPHD